MAARSSKKAESNLNQLNRPARILVDGHGGDHAPGIVIDSLAGLVNRSGQNITIGISGLPEVLAPMMKACGIETQVEIVPATEIIGMCEAPATVLRSKKNSSMHVGLRAVRDGLWDAFVSAGNTGALMAISKIILKTLPGIDRPVIASMIPNIDGRTLLLDAGANVGCNSGHLIQFAVMGSCYMQYVEGIQSPRVGLLNIGAEAIKGTDVIKVAASELEESELEFIGNVEGTAIFSNNVDVVVCDGFVGNVALKTMEGVAGFILHQLKEALNSDVAAKTGKLFVKGAMKRFMTSVHPSEYNGAPFLGLNGVVVKSHGAADSKGFTHAVEIASREVNADVRSKICEILQ